MQFYLAQRKTDISGLSMENIMNKISSFVRTNLKSKLIKLNKKEFEQFTITTSNKDSNQILTDYLYNFPLLTSKYLDFKCFERASFLYFNKLHRNPIYFEEIKFLKSSMNNSRIEFN